MLAGGDDGPHAPGLAAGVACVTGQPGTVRVLLPHSTRPCRGTGLEGPKGDLRASDTAAGAEGGLGALHLLCLGQPVAWLQGLADALATAVFTGTQHGLCVQPGLSAHSPLQSSAWREMAPLPTPPALPGLLNLPSPEPGHNGRCKQMSGQAKAVCLHRLWQCQLGTAAHWASSLPLLNPR